MDKIPFLVTIADFFKKISEDLPFLAPLADPMMVGFVLIGLVIAAAYWITGSWFGGGGGGGGRDDYEDGYRDGRDDY